MVTVGNTLRRQNSEKMKIEFRKVIWKNDSATVIKFILGRSWGISSNTVKFIELTGQK